MDRYYTVMVIPERDKGVKAFRIPRLIFLSMAFIVVIFSIFLGILGYNYFQIQKQVYENKHLTLENQHLKDQMRYFQRKLNSLTDDIQRIHTFEKKLRIITGAPLDKAAENDRDRPTDEAQQKSTSNQLPKKRNRFDEEFTPATESDHGHAVSEFNLNLDFSQMTAETEYIELKETYDQKIASIFGIQSSYNLTKEWTNLTKQSFALAEAFATFDYKYKFFRNLVGDLELKVHELDQHLLDRESFLKSTPTILPTRGWITSYYGPRKSPYSGRTKMHEGLDIGAKSGTNILAPADGIVTFSGHKPGFGKFVQIDHGYGVETIFGHASKTLVRKGERIERGHKIAKVGNTGLSTGPHLHYEVRVNGIAVDPLYFILD